MPPTLENPSLEEREFTDKHGSKITGTFERLEEDGNIVLTTGGKLVRFPVTELSDADQNYAVTQSGGVSDYAEDDQGNLVSPSGDSGPVFRPDTDGTPGGDIPASNIGTFSNATADRWKSRPYLPTREEAKKLGEMIISAQNKSEVPLVGSGTEDMRINQVAGIVLAKRSNTLVNYINKWIQSEEGTAYYIKTGGTEGSPSDMQRKSGLRDYLGGEQSGERHDMLMNSFGYHAGDVMDPPPLNPDGSVNENAWGNMFRTSSIPDTQWIVKNPEHVLDLETGKYIQTQSRYEIFAPRLTKAGTYKANFATEEYTNNVSDENPWPAGSTWTGWGDAPGGAQLLQYTQKEVKDPKYNASSKMSREEYSARWDESDATTRAQLETEWDKKEAGVTEAREKGEAVEQAKVDAAAKAETEKALQEKKRKENEWPELDPRLTKEQQQAILGQRAVDDEKLRRRQELIDQKTEQVKQDMLSRPLKDERFEKDPDKLAENRRYNEEARRLKAEQAEKDRVSEIHEARGEGDLDPEEQAKIRREATGQAVAREDQAIAQREANRKAASLDDPSVSTFGSPWEKDEQGNVKLDENNQPIMGGRGYDLGKQLADTRQAQEGYVGPDEIEQYNSDVSQNEERIGTPSLIQDAMARGAPASEIEDLRRNMEINDRRKEFSQLAAPEDSARAKWVEKRGEMTRPEGVAPEDWGPRLEGELEWGYGDEPDMEAPGGVAATGAPTDPQAQAWQDNMHQQHLLDPEDRTTPDELAFMNYERGEQGLAPLGFPGDWSDDQKAAYEGNKWRGQTKEVAPPEAGGEGGQRFQPRRTDQFAGGLTELNPQPEGQAFDYGIGEAKNIGGDESRGTAGDRWGEKRIGQSSGDAAAELPGMPTRDTARVQEDTQKQTEVDVAKPDSEPTELELQERWKAEQDLKVGQGLSSLIKPGAGGAEALSRADEAALAASKRFKLAEGGNLPGGINVDQPTDTSPITISQTQPGRTKSPTIIEHSRDPNNPFGDTIGVTADDPAGAQPPPPIADSRRSLNDDYSRLDEVAQQYGKDSEEYTATLDEIVANRKIREPEGAKGSGLTQGQLDSTIEHHEMAIKENIDPLTGGPLSPEDTESREKYREQYDQREAVTKQLDETQASGAGIRRPDSPKPLPESNFSTEPTSTEPTLTAPAPPSSPEPTDAELDATMEGARQKKNQETLDRLTKFGSDIGGAIKQKFGFGDKKPERSVKIDANNKPLPDLSTPGAGFDKDDAERKRREEEEEKKRLLVPGAF